MTKKYIKTATIAILLFLLPCTTFSQESKSNGNSRKVLSLKECIEIGLENNYSIRIQRNESEIAKNNATWGNAGALPKLDATASYGGSDNTTKTTLTDDTSTKSTSFNTTLNTSLDLSWTIFNGFAVQADMEKLRQLKIQGDLNLQQEIEDFIADLSSKYYSLIRQRIRLHNLAQSVKLSKERLRIVQESYNIGLASGLDYQQAKVDFNADTSSFIDQVELVKTTEIELNRLMALENISQPVFITDSLLKTNYDLDYNAIWEDVQKKNVQLLKSNTQMAISQAELKKTLSRNYPYLKLNAGYGYKNFGYERGTTDHSSQYGPTLTMSAGFNIFDGLNRNRERKNAKISVENSRLQAEDVALSVRADMESLWIAYQNTQELLEIEKGNLGVAQSNYEIAMERYRLRELSGIELREAQLSLLNSMERLSTAEYNLKLCEVSLLQLSGNIVDANL